MTRNPFRELENDLEDLKAETAAEVEEYLVAYRDPRTRELTTKDGEPVDPDDPTTFLLIIEDVVVMERERAEKNDLEILGPTEDVSDDRDIVRVPSDAYREVDDQEWATE